MRKEVIVKTLPQAFKVIKEMDLATEGWESDYRVAGRDALRAIVEGQMRDRVSWYLEEMGRLAGGGPLARGVDRRNGSFSRHLVTELGDIELHIPVRGTLAPCRWFGPMPVVLEAWISSFWPVLCWVCPPAR